MLFFLDVISPIPEFYIIEDNKLKHGKFIPGVKIPIKKKSPITDKNSIVLVLAWNFFNEIVKNNKNLSNNFININQLCLNRREVYFNFCTFILIICGRYITIMKFD